jgi:hypothetical protein
MQKHRIDFSRLLGFDGVADQAARGLDFQDEMIGAHLGAKVGGEASGFPCRELDCQRLLGFDTLANETPLSGPIDFRSDGMEAKLGAKVGGETLVALDAPHATPQCSPPKSK